MEHKRYGKLPTNAQSVIDEIEDLGFNGDAVSWDAVFRETEPADMAETVSDATIELRAMRTIEARRERAANEPRYLRNEPADLTMRLERRIASAEQRIADLERRERAISGLIRDTHESQGLALEFLLNSLERNPENA